MGWLYLLCVLFILKWVVPFRVVLAGVDAAGQEAAGIVAGIRMEGGARLDYNEITLRLEARDEFGNLLEEISAGSVGRIVHVAGQEYCLSFGKNDEGRPTALVRLGPTMIKPLFINIFGRKAVLSRGASLTATILENDKVLYEPSICGEVYYIEESENIRAKASRLANPGKAE